MFIFFKFKINKYKDKKCFFDNRFYVKRRNSWNVFFIKGNVVIKLIKNKDIFLFVKI